MKEFRLDYTMAIDAGLGFGYDPYMGNITLSKDEQSPENLKKALDLIKKYPFHLVMGFEGEKGEEYLFISEREFLIENS